MNKWLRGTNAIVLGLAVVGIFVVLTLALSSMKTLQFDLTQNKKFSLSDQTIGALNALEQDVRIVLITSSEVPQQGGTDPFIKRQVTDLIEEYKKRSRRVISEEFDALKNPAVAKQYEADPSGTIIVEQGTQRKTLYFQEMFLPGQQPGAYKFSGEEKLTQALVNLNVKEKRKVYMLSGHNELPLSKLFLLKSGLEGDNYEVRDLNLLREGQVPGDAELIFILGPQNDLSEKEVELLRSYVQGKGKLYVALGFNKDMATRWSNLDGLLRDFGLIDTHAITIEPKQSVLFDPLTIIPEYGFHDITKKLKEYNRLTMMNLAIALNVDSASESFIGTPILRTTSTAYGETDIEGLTRNRTAKDEKDINGPLNLGFVVETKDKKPKAVVLGGSSFLADEMIGQQGNRDFALNTVGWLQEQKDQITIRPREGDAYQKALLTGVQAEMIFYGTIIGFPLVILFIGGVIWWRRRKG